MPKTIEEKSANSRAAVKWERAMGYQFVSRSVFQSISRSGPSAVRLTDRTTDRLFLLSNRDVVRLDHADDIQQAGDNQVLGAVVGGGVGDIALAEIHALADDVKAAGADVAYKSQHIEHVAGIEGVELALHEQAQDKHGDDGAQQQQASSPALLEQVSGPRDQPGEDGGEQSAGRQGLLGI